MWITDAPLEAEGVYVSSAESEDRQAESLDQRLREGSRMWRRVAEAGLGCTEHGLSAGDRRRSVTDPTPDLTLPGSSLEALDV